MVIQSLLNAGIPLADARNYGDLGCSEIVVCGKTCSGGNMGNVCLAMCLDLALHDGMQHWYYDGQTFHPAIHMKLGPHTGDPRTFRSMDQLRSAYSAQVRYFVDQLAVLDNILDHIQAELVPHVFYSLIVDGCIESGKDFTAGGAVYNQTSPLAAGPITASDSLAAVKTAVFEEQRISMEELLAELKRRGKTLVLATSKPEPFAREILDHFHLTSYFTYAAGATLDETRVKKEEVIAYAMESCGITDPGQVLMVGDRRHDIEGARANGVDSLGVLWPPW